MTLAKDGLALVQECLDAETQKALEQAFDRLEGWARLNLAHFLNEHLTLQARVRQLEARAAAAADRGQGGMQRSAS